MLPDEALKWILTAEGGYKNDPEHDPGDPTNFGITTPTLKYCNQIGLVNTNDVRNLTNEDVRKIYDVEYWRPCRADEMPLKIGLILFDCAVNSGVGTAVKLLRRAINIVSVERKVEVSTQLCSELIHVILGLNENDLAKNYLTVRLNFYKSLTEYKHNPGWVNRLNNLAKHINIDWVGAK